VRMNRVFPVIAAAAVSVMACEDNLSGGRLISDDELNNDIAASAGDAIASTIVTMEANEASGGLTGASVQYAVTAQNAQTLDFERTRTCYDGSNAVVPNCSPLSSVRKIVTHVTIDGTRSGSHATRTGGTATWDGVVHRVADDTVVRNFNAAAPPVETSRTHSGVATGKDTTTVSNGDITRVSSETSTDSIKAVTWNLPRSSNPFPVSGSIKRVLSASIEVTNGSRTETRAFNRTITVTFPADAQGNVVLQVNDRTCNLNLVTRVVSNCS
jgi:hypothetical protein